MRQRSTTCAGVLPSRLEIALIVGSARTLPLASGDHASVMIPCSALTARTSSLQRRMHLDLIDGRHHFALLDDALEMGDLKVGEPDGPGAPFVEELFKREPSREEVTAIQGRQW